MHTYIKTKNEDLWTVGHYEAHCDSDGAWWDWKPMRDFGSVAEAEAYTNYLNGGTGDVFKAKKRARR